MHKRHVCGLVNIGIRYAGDEMRQVKIVNDGFLETEDGHPIECPKKFKQCHTTCAWFSILEYARMSNQPPTVKPDCCCQDTEIGELIE